MCLWAVAAFTGVCSKYKAQAPAGRHYGLRHQHLQQTLAHFLHNLRLADNITHLFVSHGFLVFSREDREGDVGSWAISLAIPSQRLFSHTMLCQTQKGSPSNHCKQVKQNSTHKYLGAQRNKCDNMKMRAESSI